MEMKALYQQLSRVKYIALSPDELVGNIDKVIIRENRIYVLDASITEKIFIYDTLGHVVNIISGKGKGPGEYAALGDMSFDDCTNELLVSDQLMLSMLHFSADGKYLKTEKRFEGIYFEMFRGNTIHQLPYSQYQFVETIGDSIKRKMFPYTPLQKRAPISRALFFNHNNDLLLKPVLSDTVYQILNDTAYQVKYVFKQQKSIWNKYDQPVGLQEFLLLINNSNYTYTKPPICETEQYLFFSMVEAKEGQSVVSTFFYSNADRITYALNFEDMDFNDWLPYPIDVHGNQFVGFIEPEMIDNIKEHMDKAPPLRNKELHQIIANAPKFTNHILVLYEFKNKRK